MPLLERCAEVGDDELDASLLGRIEDRGSLDRAEREIGPQSLQWQLREGQEADAEARLDGPLLVGERIRPVVAGDELRDRVGIEAEAEGGRRARPRRVEEEHAAAAEPRHRASGIARASR